MGRHAELRSRFVLLPPCLFARNNNRRRYQDPTFRKLGMMRRSQLSEVPLAASGFAPKHVPADYYYKIPAQPMFKQYPVYAPGHEPPGYIDQLTQQEPVVIWDDKGQAPVLKTEQDWIHAGELVFDYPVFFGSLFVGEDRKDLYVRDPEFYRRTGTPVAADGTVPSFRYVVKKKG
ncbi:MAG: hypothetical protein JO185_01725, partial [Acidobacteriaceae bacterium]|nr:hypothetical protein [Acidobacteriaceae bacterium]